MAYIRCSDQLHQLVKVEAAKRQMGMGDLTDLAVRELLKTENTSEPRPSSEEVASERYPKSSLPDHDLLQFVLEGDQQAAEWIRGNLRMFAEAIRSRSGKAKSRRKAS